jgi:hypothetical protein
MFIVYTTTQDLLGLEQVFFFTLKRHTHQTSKASESWKDRFAPHFAHNLILSFATSSWYV